ncbi:MAG TPA: class I adenylate-forming enzyme family protein [Acidimicrobiia bacterium]
MSVLDGVLRQAATRHPARRAVVHDGRELTYAQLDALTERVAAGLAQRGVQAGHLAALVLPSSAEYVVAYLALARLDAIGAGVTPRATAAERGAVLERARPDLILATPELTDGVPGDIATVTIEQLGAAHILSELQSDRPAPLSTTVVRDDHPETVVFTSGTTGTPKGALFTSAQMAAITRIDTGGAWGTGGAQLVATGLPHVGFMTKLAGYLQLGCTLHVLTRWRAADALAVIAREKIEFIGGVAAQISLLLGVPDFDHHDLGAVRGLIVGAGPSPAALVQEARRRFDAGYSVRYSSTESGGLGTLTAFDAPDDELLHTVGRPRPGTEVEIRDPETGTLCDVDAIGQVCLRSDAVMARYWRDPEATGRALDADRWLRTGDLGAIDAHGRLRITGRIGEMYIRGGYNVFPLEVEAVLLDHPAVAAVAVVPRPDPVMGEIGVAVTVARDSSAPPTLDSLRDFARQRLAAYKLPEAIRAVDALPLTAMDKLDRRALARHEAEHQY